MDRSDLLAAFARDKVDPSAISSDLQTELALRFAELYERHGLIREAIAPPLWDCCPNGADCWRAAWDARPTDGPEDGGVSLPWIGPNYRAGGVVVLGITQHSPPQSVVPAATAVTTDLRDSLRQKRKRGDDGRQLRVGRRAAVRQTRASHGRHKRSAVRSPAAPTV